MIIYYVIICILESLPHKHKIVIAGNHELSFDETFAFLFKKNFGTTTRHTGGALEDEVPNYGRKSDDIQNAVNSENINQYLTNCIYLQDSSTVLYGINIYGAPWYFFSTLFQSVFT